MSIVLITGSCGLVGSESVKFFSTKGFDVVGIDNNSRAKFFFTSEVLILATHFLGSSFNKSYIDQYTGFAELHADIDMEKTIWEQITNGQEQIRVGGKLINSRAYVAKFNFNGSDQNKKVSVLSGGERNRLHLAMTLREEANVLLLDEPTNDLDVNTLSALEEGLDHFAGCAVIISHDRWFLDRVCTHILAFEGDSNVVYFEGCFSDYEENRKKRIGNVIPKRIKYRKLKKS